MDISPLARPFPALPEIAGVGRATATAGYKNWTRADLTGRSVPVADDVGLALLLRAGAQAA